MVIRISEQFGRVVEVGAGPGPQCVEKNQYQDRRTETRLIRAGNQKLGKKSIKMVDRA